VAGPTGIEPATPGLKVRCSSLTELRTHQIDAADRKTTRGFFSVSIPSNQKQLGISFTVLSALKQDGKMH
jgi:hypothetical protein